ncbi:MAG: S1/P1 nuclease [Legionellales bacterium]
MLRIVFFFSSLLFALNCHSWNAMGHQLIAQIAYDNLTPKAKYICSKYNNSVRTYSKNNSFVYSSIWLDVLKTKDVHWFDSLHYIDLPFSKDATSLPSIQEHNALWAIKQATAVLSSKKSSVSDKGLGLRILIHVVGDIHQPLHTATLVSQQQPQGDLGGNLFLLGSNPIGRNLHQYWDKGAGSLVGLSTKYQIKNRAHELEENWPCQMAAEGGPEQWVNLSHQLAVTQVYKIGPGTTPGKQYQSEAQMITQKQIASAGCRLAALLNKICES